MRKSLSILLLLTLSFSINAQELTVKALQGKWLIVKVGDLVTKDLGLGKDIWEFRGNQWIVSSSGKEFSPELYEVKGSELAIGKLKIQVSIFTINKMLVSTNGIVQTLEKIK